MTGRRTTPESQQELVELVRDALTPDLLKPIYRSTGRPNSSGHCYAASEALFHLLGGKAAGWVPQSIRHEGVSHWFLKHRLGEIIDATEDQFETPVPHERAVGRGFLTWEPSKRASEIMRRVGKSYS